MCNNSPAVASSLEWEIKRKKGSSDTTLFGYAVVILSPRLHSFSLVPLLVQDFFELYLFEDLIKDDFFLDSLCVCCVVDAVKNHILLDIFVNHIVKLFSLRIMKA